MKSPKYRFLKLFKLFLQLGLISLILAFMNWRGVAQPGRVPALGAGCRWFDSSHPDHFRKLYYLL